MKKLKQVTVNFMAGEDNRNILFTNVTGVYITQRFLEVTFGDSETFTLKLDKLVFYTIK